MGRGGFSWPLLWYSGHCAMAVPAGFMGVRAQSWGSDILKYCLPTDIQKKGPPSSEVQYSKSYGRFGHHHCAGLRLFTRRSNQRAGVYHGPGRYDPVGYRYPHAALQVHFPELCLQLFLQSGKRNDASEEYVAVGIRHVFLEYRGSFVEPCRHHVGGRRCPRLPPS